MTTVLHHSQAKGTAKLLLLGIANHEGDGGAWPSIATLARYAGCTEPQVRRLCRQLVELKELTIEFNEGGERDSDPRYRPNRYRVLVSCPPTCDGSTAHRDSDRASMHPLRDSDRAAGRVQGARTGSPGRAPTRGESLLETSIEPSINAATPRRARHGSTTRNDGTINDARAVLIADAVWKLKSPKPAIGYLRVKRVARQLVDAGWADDEATIAIMVRVPTISVGWCETERNKSSKRSSNAAGPSLAMLEQIEREYEAKQATTTKETG